MKNDIRKPTVLLLTCITILFGSTNAFAKDCKARFQIINEWKNTNNTVACEIKAKKFSIVGDKGAWDENITNKKIDFNTYHVTSMQTLNKLSVGHTGSFTLHFDERCAGPHSAWTPKTHGPFNLSCHSNTIWVPVTVKH